MKNSKESDTTRLSAAEKMCNRHLNNEKKYQYENPEKMKEKAKGYMQKLKNDSVSTSVPTFLGKKKELLP